MSSTTTSKILLIAAAFGLISACDHQPKVRSWRDWTGAHPQYSPAYIERTQVDDLRAAALATRGPAETMSYGYALAVFVWENRDLFAAIVCAARDPEYTYETPPSVAGFDQAAYLADWVMLAKEQYPRVGTFGPAGATDEEKWTKSVIDSYPFVVALATTNCELMRDTVAEAAACDSQKLDFEYVHAVCEPDPVAFGALCRKIFDAIPDLDDRYYLMGQCGAEIVPGNGREGAATWATEEEMAFFDKMRKKREFEQVLAAGNRAAAARENQQRAANYAQDQANYEASQGPINGVSQIGSLDDSGRPAAPEMVEVRGFDAPPTGSVDVSYTLTISSACAEPIELGTADGGPSLVVEANSTFTITVPNCTRLCLFTSQREQLDCESVTRPATYEILDTCGHLRRVVDLDQIGAP